VAGCCPGRLLEPAVAWGGLSLLRHPVELYEIVAWVAFWYLLRRVPIERVPALFALCFGATRLVLCSLREPSSFSASAHFSPEAFAAAWIAAGLLGLGLPFAIRRSDSVASSQ
jgi:prolipoprotein diacylglyceryltransferase